MELFKAKVTKCFILKAIKHKISKGQKHHFRKEGKCLKESISIELDDLVARDKLFQGLDAKTANACCFI